MIDLIFILILLAAAVLGGVLAMLEPWTSRSGNRPMRLPTPPRPPRFPLLALALLPALLVLMAAAGVPGLALAATVGAPSSVIDLAPLVTSVIVPLLTAVLLAVATWALNKAAAYFHIQVQASQRQVVNDAIANAIAYAQAKLGPAETVSADATVAAAVGYLLPKVPDALKGLGITPDHLAQLVTARLAPAPPLQPSTPQ